MVATGRCSAQSVEKGFYLRISCYGACQPPAAPCCRSDHAVQRAVPQRVRARTSYAATPRTPALAATVSVPDPHELGLIGHDVRWRISGSPATESRSCRQLGLGDPLAYALVTTRAPRSSWW